MQRLDQRSNWDRNTKLSLVWFLAVGLCKLTSRKHLKLPFQTDLRDFAFWNIAITCNQADDFIVGLWYSYIVSSSSSKPLIFRATMYDNMQKMSMRKPKTTANATPRGFQQTSFKQSTIILLQYIYIQLLSWKQASLLVAAARTALSLQGSLFAQTKKNAGTGVSGLSTQSEARAH
jgi:hypothetical protein